MSTLNGLDVTKLQKTIRLKFTGTIVAVVIVVIILVIVIVIISSSRSPILSTYEGKEERAKVKTTRCGRGRDVEFARCERLVRRGTFQPPSKRSTRALPTPSKRTRTRETKEEEEEEETKKKKKKEKKKKKKERKKERKRKRNKEKEKMKNEDGRSSLRADFNKAPQLLFIFRMGASSLVGATSSARTAYPLVSEAATATAYKYVSTVINGLQLSKYEGIPTPVVA
ncbi:hypothetical protein V1478_004800 [Vespula squamosa]|uniref:Uncharacterized protein n=1 Tax=Vespula squamosa TaxID=30214 RepID=A0ABD2BEU6_VESSQ